MKISTLTDLLATAGLALIAAGLFLWHPFLILLFAGALLVLLARLLERRENQSRAAKENQ